MIDLLLRLSRQWRAVSFGLGLLPAVSAAADPLVLVGANLILMVPEETIVRDGVVVIEGDRIVAVGARSEVTVPAPARLIRVDGAWIVPGLADMHVHAGERGLALMIANGVTTARELSGSEQHLVWSREIAAGARVGPRLVVFSPLLSDRKQPSAFRIVSDVTAARELTASFATAGYAGLKLYDGLAADVYATFVAEGKARGLKLTGHIPEAVGLSAVLRAGQSLEHAEKTVMAVMGHGLDGGDLSATAEAIRAAGVWMTPTLAVHEVLARQRTRAYGERLNRPELAWMSGGTLAWWNTLRGEGEFTEGSFGAKFLSRQRELIRLLAAAGSGLLVGTDTPNPGMVPGFAVVDELLALERAGLSRQKALSAATVAVADYLGESGRSGVIAPGARADLVLLRSNPLEHLEALRHPLGVVAAGRWFDRAALDDLLDKARPSAR